MKKILSVLFFIFFIAIISKGEFIEYDEGTLDNQVLRMFPDKISISFSDDIILNYSKENLSDKMIYFFALSIPIKECEGRSFCLKIEGNDSEKIIWKYDLSSTSMGGSIGRKIPVGEILSFQMNLNDFIDIANVGQTNLIFYPKVEIQCLELKNENSNAGNAKHLGFYEIEPFRLFINMEGQLVNLNIEVNPDKWNLNWFHMAQDKGVFTVWIKEMPEGYSVNDIKQDTILMNGVLKPTDVKIVGAEGKERMEIKFSKREGISYIGYIESGSKKKINISGQFTDEKWFIGEAEIEITGKQEHNRYQKQKHNK
ncbi:hypothetical protein KAU33_14310 [Candidatus Dependentiae bacterium]|nr:hypothetical protein [Candidatus Dependentiae bacterium]